MSKTTLKQKLLCPYCSTKQEYKSKDYFAGEAIFSSDIQCDNCDELFNARIEEGVVYTFSNICSKIPVRKN